MDGNGRWAPARGLPRMAGHKAGVETVRRVVEAAPNAGIGILTPVRLLLGQLAAAAGGGQALMGMMETYLERETAVRRETASVWK